MSLYLYSVSDNRQFIADVPHLLRVHGKKGDTSLEIISPSAMRSNIYAQYFNTQNLLENYQSVEFMQLSSWISNLWASAGLKERLINPSLRRLFLRRVLLDLLSDAKTSLEDKNFYQHEGTLQRLLTLITQRGVEPLQGKSASLKQSKADQAVALVVDRYRDTLANSNYIELQDAIRLLKSKPPTSENIPIFVGFGAYGLAEAELIVQTSKGKDVLVAIPKLEVEHCDTYGILLSKGFSRLAEELKAELIFQDHDSDTPCLASTSDGGENGQGILCIANNLFNVKPFELTSALGEGWLQLCFAEGQGAQEVLIVEKSQELFESSDSDKIAIIVRKSKRNLLRVAQKLEERSIFVDLDIRIGFEDSQFGIVFTRLLSLIAKIHSGDTEHQLGYELLGLLQAPFFGIDPLSRDLYDSLAKRKRLEPKDILKDISVGTYGLKSKVMAKCFQAFKTKTAESWADLVNSLMEQFLSDFDRGRVETIVNTAAHHRIMEALSDIASSKSPLSDSTGMQKIEANEIIENILGSQLTITEGVGAQSRILLTEAHRLIDREFEHVIFAELSASEYGGGGANVPAEANFLYMHDTRGAVLAPRPDFEIKSHEEKDFFTRVLRSAQKSLVLIAKMSDEYGSRQAPSFPLTFFLRESIIHDAVYSEGDFLTESSKLGIQIKYAREADSLSNLLSRGTREGESTGEAPKLPIRGDINTRFNFWSTLENQTPEVAERFFSPSALERYAKCPYSWLISRNLPSDSLETPVDQRVLGTTVHRLLEEFYKAWSEKYKTNVPRIYEWSETGLCESHTAIDKDRANVLFDSIQLSEDFLTTHYHNPLLPSDETKIEEARIAARRRIISDMSSVPTSLPGTDSSMFELTLGEGGTPTRVGGLKIRGQADRVDLSKVKKNGRHTVFVYDYKGSFENKTHFINQLKIQAPIYLLALARENDWKPGGYSYLSYKSAGNSGELNEKYLSDLLKENTSLEPVEREDFITKNIKKKISTFPKDPQKLGNQLQETLNETELILDEIRQGLEAGMAPVALESSLGGRGLSMEHKECKYCLYTACVIKQKVDDSITEMKEQSLILDNRGGGNDE